MPTFKDLLSRTKEVVDAALIPIKAMQAKNDLQKGIFDVKSQLLDATSNKISKQSCKDKAIAQLEELKGVFPFNVQGILDAKRKIDSCDLEITAAAKHEEYLQGTLDFLIQLDSELFPA